MNKNKCWICGFYLTDIGLHRKGIYFYCKRCYTSYFKDNHDYLKRMSIKLMFDWFYLDMSKKLLDKIDMEGEKTYRRIKRKAEESTIKNIVELL